MRTITFDPYSPIYIISFLSSFKSACNTDRIHEGAVMWLLPLFLKKRAAEDLISRPGLNGKSYCRRQKEWPLAKYCVVVNYISETYGTEDGILETDAETMMFAQTLDKTPIN